MIEHSPTIAELCKGLHGAQGVLTGVFKGKVNPAFKSKYANLEAVLDTIRPGLQANGLVVTQAPGRIVDGALEVTTMLIHVSGEWWRATTHVPLVKRDPQGMGSATTYGLRYSLMAALGVPPSEDDDGVRAGNDTRGSTQAKPAPAANISACGPTEADRAKASGWIAEVNECQSRNDLSALFRTPEWDAAKADMTPEAQKLVQDALARHPQYQARAAA